ncbi:hypothetical protein QFZ77_003024 [Paenibacillus sp. V4I3]|uniref:hypothetical protein n=1 Tax=Paenibacillus sp. V4I3 TaxID=3042305 RepID=UPI0027817934|nr:hypothetical protein [Paenibacillus sp. V4I3]MDQ0874365.1 hypothetical protein [Paenibacillus sp. V4I3]MDQ0897433.1 hypothetical protein [Paenibacillus sp. V4I7]
MLSKFLSSDSSFCNQGWVLLLKDNSANQMFYECSECYAQYDNYVDIDKQALPLDTHTGEIVIPRDEEIINNSLFGYLIVSWKGKKLIIQNGEIIAIWNSELRSYDQS